VTRQNATPKAFRRKLTSSTLGDAARQIDRGIVVGLITLLQESADTRRSEMQLVCGTSYF
jgi:hypothetical protein